jgi:heat shock protein HtpX
MIPTPVLQAMSAGSREAPSIAVTSGLLQSLPARELAAVLAHEIAHLRYGDMFVMRVAAGAGSMPRAMSSAGVFLLVAYFPVLWTTGEVVSPAAIALLMGAPMVSDLLELSLSRRREFLADAGAVELTGDPTSLARALERIARLQGDDWGALHSARRAMAALVSHPPDDRRTNRSSEPEGRRAPVRAAELQLAGKPARVRALGRPESGSAHAPARTAVAQHRRSRPCCRSRSPCRPAIRRWSPMR